jgi:hypothetical protein
VVVSGLRTKERFACLNPQLATCSHEPAGDVPEALRIRIDATTRQEIRDLAKREGWISRPSFASPFCGPRARAGVEEREGGRMSDGSQPTALSPARKTHLAASALLQSACNRLEQANRLRRSMSGKGVSSGRSSYDAHATAIRAGDQDPAQAVSLEGADIWRRACVRGHSEVDCFGSSGGAAA